MKTEEFDRKSFACIAPNIYRLCIPFENIYTSVFALVEVDDCIILDAANGPQDVETIILPAIRNAGFHPTYLLCSHTHGDHSGGMQTLSSTFPQAEICLFDRHAQFGRARLHRLEDGDVLLGRYQVFNLKGHTDDCLSVYDPVTKCLLTGDCLQQYGVGCFRTNVTDKAAYLRTLERISTMDVAEIICSHDYEPCGWCIREREQIDRLLAICAETVM